MAANFFGIEKTLLMAVEQVDSETPLTRFGDEIGKHKPDGLWLQLFNLRGDSVPVTLGDQGEDENRGVLQIDVNFPKGRGTGTVTKKADEFANFFTAGKSLSYNAQVVKIVSCSLNPGRYVGGYYRVSLSIRYYARTTRSQ